MEGSKMEKEITHSVRISQPTFLKLWDLQLELMRREGQKTSLQTLIDEAVLLLVQENGS